MICPDCDEDHEFERREGPGDTSVGIMWESWYVCRRCGAACDESDLDAVNITNKAAKP
jgi:hypothetical protein